jgi:hypothetical protein
MLRRGAAQGLFSVALAAGTWLAMTILLPTCGRDRATPEPSDSSRASQLMSDIGSSTDLTRGTADVAATGALEATASMQLTNGSPSGEGAGLQLMWADGNPGTSFLVIHGPAFVGSRWTSGQLVLAYQLLGRATGSHPRCRVHIERVSGGGLRGSFVCPEAPVSGVGGQVHVRGTFTAAP